MTFRSFLLVPILLLTLLAGCATTRRDTQRWVVLPTAMEVNIGQSMAGSISQQYKIHRDAKITAYVQALGAKVASVW